MISYLSSTTLEFRTNIRLTFYFTLLFALSIISKIYKHPHNSTISVSHETQKSLLTFPDPHLIGIIRHYTEESTPENQNDPRNYWTLNYKLSASGGNDANLPTDVKNAKDNLRNALIALHQYPQYQYDHKIAWREQHIEQKDLNVLKAHEGNQKPWSFNQFVSTSTDYQQTVQMAKRKEGLKIIFEIQVFQGTLISEFSAFKSEKEVLLLPESKFKVIKVDGPRSIGFTNGKNAEDIIMVDQVVFCKLEQIAWDESGLFAKQQAKQATQADDSSEKYWSWFS